MLTPINNYYLLNQKQDKDILFMVLLYYILIVQRIWNLLLVRALYEIYIIIIIIIIIIITITVTLYLWSVWD